MPAVEPTVELAVRKAPSDRALVAVGFSLHSTGLERVMRSVLGSLAERYACHFLAIGYKGPVANIAPDGGPGFTLHPSNLRGGDAYGGYRARELAEEVGAGTVFLLNDLWMLESYRRALEPLAGTARVVAHVPLDGRIVDESILEPLTFISRFVVMTEFARRELAVAVKRLRASRPDLSWGEIGVIPHGVDIDRFRPLAGAVEDHFRGPGRLPWKRQVFGDRPGLEESFIVLNANRPNPRKRIDLTLEAFALFARGKPANVKLYLHHAILEAPEREALVAQARAKGIEERLELTPVTAEAGYVDDEQLNRIYNACDVGINTAMGEGWGLVSFEHGAAGAAQIVPGHSACAELWQGAAEVLPAVRQVRPSYSPLELAEVSAADGARALDRLYRDRSYRQELSLAAWKNARRPEYRWERIADRWQEVFA